jgi:hypothetical protein
MTEAVRQGDVLLVRVDKLPTGAVRRQGTEGRIVVEVGEATGHAHTLDPVSVEAYDVVSEAGAIVYQAYRVLQRTPLTHDEHPAIVLEPGIWERWYQVESDGEAERQIRD